MPTRDPQNIKESHYYTHLQKKSFARCVILLIPVLGNIVVGLRDLNDIKYAYTLDAIKKDWTIVLTASERIRKNENFMLAALEKRDSGDAVSVVRAASENLKANKTFMLAALRRCCHYRSCVFAVQKEASYNVRMDPDFSQTTVSQIYPVHVLAVARPPLEA